MSLKELIETDRPHLSESSLKTYLFSLKKLGITEVRDIKMLSDPTMIFEKIADYKLTQQRNLLSSVLIIITASGEASEQYETYRKYLFDLGLKYTAELAENKKTQVQEENWVTMDELRKITRSKLRKAPQCQESLICALYAYQPPCRLDYYDCQIVKSEDDLTDDKNYLLIKSPRYKQFVFNDYKTKNKYGTTRVDVSKELNSVLNKFLKLNPDRKYLLQQKRKAEPLSRNQLGKMLPLAFSQTGKNVTINIIRHCYVSENVNLPEVKKLQELSKAMLHSQQEQINYAKLE